MCIPLNEGIIAFFSALLCKFTLHFKELGELGCYFYDNLLKRFMKRDAFCKDG